MDDNTELIETVKNWLEIDNQIKTLQKETKQRRDIKKELTQKLVHIMKEKDLDFMNITGGQIVRTQTKTKSPLSKKHLLTTLLTYFKHDPTIATNLGKFILDTRQEKIKENIKKKIIK